MQSRNSLFYSGLPTFHATLHTLRGTRESAPDGSSGCDPDAQTLKKKAFAHQLERKSACYIGPMCYFSRRSTPRGGTALTDITFEE
jgi:hypothetical protein